MLIRNLPDEVHAGLVRRAGAADQSVTAYVRQVLTDHTRALSVEEWLARVEALAPAGAAGGRTGADWVAEGRATAGDDTGPG